MAEDTLTNVTADIYRQIDERNRQNDNFTGASSGADTTEATNAADAEGTLGLIGRGFESLNFAEGSYEWAQRKLVDVDPEFDARDHMQEFQKGIPMEYWHVFEGTRSMAEAQLLHSQLLKDEENKRVLGYAGTRGVVAAGLAGIVDLDLPLTLLSDGSYTGGKIGKALSKTGLTPQALGSIGMKDTRLERIVSTGLAGAEASAFVQAGNTVVRPNGDWTDVPSAALAGMVFGSALGTVLPKGAVKEANDNLAMTKEEFLSTRNSGFANRDPNVTLKGDNTFNMEVHDSVGAASMRDPAELPNTAGLTDSVKSMRDEAILFNQENGLGTTHEFSFADNASGRIAQRFYDFVKKTPWASDSDRLWNSNSPIGRAFAYKIAESPSGIYRNNRSAANIMGRYTTMVHAPVAESYESAFKRWMVERKDITPTAQAWNSHGHRAEFNKQVYQELQNRYHDGTSHPDSSETVKKMADAVDQASGDNHALAALKGHEGETAVFGSEDLKAQSGWFPQKWDGNAMSKLIKSMNDQGVAKPQKVLEKTIADSYTKLHGWEAKESLKVAKAVVRRALAKQEGMDTNLYRILQEDGLEFLEKAMADHGLSKKFMEDMVAGLKGIKAEKGKESYLKHRNDLDLRTQIPGTSHTLMDAVNTDVLNVWHDYSRRVGGAAALARNGIQKADLPRIYAAIAADEFHNGGRTLGDDFFEAVDTWFRGGALNGGINPWIRRIMTTTNLSLLNSNGLTQMGEMGAAIGAMKLENFIETAPKEVRNMFKGERTPAVDEMKYAHASIIGEHNIFRPDLMKDEIRSYNGVQSQLNTFVDGLLAKGSRVQGFINGFYKVSQAEQIVAGRMLMHRLGKIARGKDKMSELRFNDLGLTPKVRDRVLSYFRDGTVTYEGDKVLSMNFDKWNPLDAEEFYAVYNRHVAQVVQKTQRGEDSYWMHNDTGAFLMHLKSFTMQSMQKQLLRNARIADPEALATFVYGMVTAAGAYAARQITNDKTENLEPTKLIKGAISYNNMTSIIPSFTDPIFGIMGLDAYKLQGVGGVPGRYDIFSVPPSITQFNRMAMAPIGVARAIADVDSKSDVYNIQSIPLVGNLYGAGYVANAMRQDIENDKAEQKKLDIEEVAK